jgi:hypothetical protein
VPGGAYALGRDEDGADVEVEEDISEERNSCQDFLPQWKLGLLG